MHQAKLTWATANRKLVITNSSGANFSKSRNRRLQQQGRVVDKEEKRRQTVRLERDFEDALPLTVEDTSTSNSTTETQQQQQYNEAENEEEQVYTAERVEVAAADDTDKETDPYAGKLERDKEEIRRKAEILMKIMQSGERMEEVIAEYRTDIDKLMLHLLARRIETSKQLEQQTDMTEGLTLLFKRLKIEYDRQKATPSLRLLDELMNILTPPPTTDNSTSNTATTPTTPVVAPDTMLKAGEERKIQAIARLRTAFGDGSVSVSNILSIAAQIAEKGAEVADALVGEAVDAEIFIQEVTTVVDKAMQQQQQLQEFLAQLPEGDERRQQVESVMSGRQQSIETVEEILSIANMLRLEAMNTAMKQK